jgi:hypothetical protein
MPSLDYKSVQQYLKEISQAVQKEKELSKKADDLTQKVL